MPLYVSAKDAARLLGQDVPGTADARHGSTRETRGAQSGSKTTSDAPPARTARRGASADMSDDEWAGTGPKGRYPVPLQYTLWLAGWLCYQTPAGFEARHPDGRRVGPCASRRAMCEEIDHA